MEDETEYEIETKLDNLLKYLLLEGYKNNDTSNNEIPNAIVKELDLENINEFKELITILSDDNYVQIINEYQYIRITTKGRVFILKGGYVLQLVKQLNSDARLNQLQKNSEDMRNKQMWLTVALVAVAVPPSIYYALEVIKFLYSYFHQH